MSRCHSWSHCRVALWVVGLVSATAMAGSSQAPAPMLTTPNPIRPVRMTVVKTRAFGLPNGSRVEIGADLDEMLVHAAGQTPNLAPSDLAEGGSAGMPGVNASCEQYLELRAAVTTLELNGTEIKFSFGYTPGGELGGALTGATGEVGVRLGTVAMVFELRECSRGSCTLRASSAVNQATAGIDAKFKIDFGVISLGPELIHDTPLGKALQNMMIKGVAQLAASPRITELGWSARVRESSPGAGTFVFDAGTQSRLSKDANQTFVVYALAPASGACDVFKSTAYAHTLRSDAVSSVAQIDQVLDPAGVKEGDVVMIRPAPVAAKAK